MEFNSCYIYYQNVRGLRTKTNEFRLGLLECNCPIIALTETWLNNTISSSELFSEDYFVFRKDRNQQLTGKGRGVEFYWQ